ncbi:MAG: prolyl oligopeptidase family serine peptidase, partial [bacterium]|nr:prolyl oligopeptidase family serine peptidase [bacterium]
MTEITAAVDWLAARKDVNSKRVAVLGEGCGGFLALSALAESPERWAAGVCVNGFADAAGQLENAPRWKRSLMEANFGVSGGGLEHLSAISPLRRVQVIRAPILLACDSGAGLSEFRDAIRSQGGVVSDVAPASGALCSRDHRIALYTEIEKFLTAHV